MAKASLPKGKPPHGQLERSSSTPHHSTVKDACELAESLGIPNLVLWHTEDSNVAGRERLYKSEGKRYYSGNIYVPDDESLIALS